MGFGFLRVDELGRFFGTALCAVFFDGVTFFVLSLTFFLGAGFDRFVLFLRVIEFTINIVQCARRIVFKYFPYWCDYASHFFVEPHR